MATAPSLWLTIPITILMLVVFVLVLRWVTRQDPKVTHEWREIDERIRRRI